MVGTRWSDHPHIIGKHHKYLTLVSDHDTSRIVWGTTGRTAAALDRFFDELPDGGAEQIEAVSMDFGPAYAKTVRARAPQAVLCFDPFHVIKLATDALDAVRRQAWQSARRYPDKKHRPQVQGCALGAAEEPRDLTGKQAETLAGLRKSGGALWRAYQLKEALRAVFAGDLTAQEVSSCSTGGAPGHSGPGSRNSSRPPAPSANTRTASPPPLTVA